ncbi:MAG: hypothetical protein CMJ78_07395 [Planctomycetaceae bacterium]|nr:hypothetical protein [Planctomycetaceae bacterium]
MHISGKSHRLDTNATYTRNQPKYLVWAGLLATSFVGMQFFVTRPLMNELAQMKKELNAVEKDLENLVGARDDVWETNNLLSSLNAQHRHIEGARASLNSIRQFRKDVEGESGRTMNAFASLDRLLAIQGTLIEQQQDVMTAGKSLKGLVAMQEQLVAQRETVESAVTAVQELAKVTSTAIDQVEGAGEAMNSLKMVAELKKTVLENAEQLASAQDKIDQMVQLQDSLSKSVEDIENAQVAAKNLVAVTTTLSKNAEGIEQAQQDASRMATLTKTIKDASSNIEAAEVNTQNLIVLKDELVNNGVGAEQSIDRAKDLITLNNTLGTVEGVNQSQDTLDTMVSMQKTISGQTQQVIDNVKNLELLADLSDEVDSHINSLQGMRRDLLEIALLETAVGRVVRAMRPLTKITDLRRLSDEQIRSAAESILEQRGTRLSNRPKVESLPPLPNEDKLFIDNEDGAIDRLVPDPPVEDVE